ncbi:hypothetical protein LX92_00551 [Maribacter polysiphoniae]|uniref:Uncharacterized protein n=1 Tax=Maribacter polysiphoniae TaxID=429344 RepID=A0A316E829_9FLAO|nr:hypothetical protein LX92_00551 [Maribacter polysiphoniae]
MGNPYSQTHKNMLISTVENLATFWYSKSLPFKEKAQLNDLVLRIIFGSNHFFGTSYKIQRYDNFCGHG